MKFIAKNLNQLQILLVFLIFAGLATWNNPFATMGGGVLVLAIYLVGNYIRFKYKR